ncbi:serine/threonine kinase [Linnemannia zychae]|nr:serine/threonine kinase [Linnemannia zychae]
MISTVTLVKRGASSSTSSTTGSSLCRTISTSATSTATISSHSSSTFPIMQSGITRHWIQSFHRMTLRPHFFQSSKHTACSSGRNTPISRHYATRSYHRSSRVQSNAAAVAETTSTKPTLQSRPMNAQQHHAPLFSRISTTGGHRLAVAPKSPYYRIQDSYEPRQLTSQDFDPFKNWPLPSKTTVRLPLNAVNSTFPELDTFPTTYWGINSLRMAASQNNSGTSSTLFRAGAEVEHTVETPLTLEVAVGIYNTESGRTDLPLGGSSSLLQSELAAARSNPKILSKLIPPELNPYILAEEFGREFAYSCQWTNPKELEASLRKIGKARMLVDGVPMTFIECSENEEDVLAMGIHAVMSPLTRENKTPWLGLFFDTLDQCNWIRLLDRSVMIRLQKNIFNPNIKPWSSETLETQKNRLWVLSQERYKRDASRIGYPEWRTITRRFRLQLASTRASGNQRLSDHDYVGFMASCVNASQFLELELAVQHYMENKPAKSPLNEAIYQIYLKGLVYQGRMDHAQEVTMSMKRTGMQLSPLTYGIMLEGYGRQMDERSMKYILKSMEKAGYSPTIEVYTSLMSNYIRADMLDKAYKVFQELDRSGIELDSQARNVSLRLAHLRGRKEPGHSDLLRAAMEILNERESVSEINTTQELGKGEEEDEERALQKEKKLHNLVIHSNHRLKENASAMNTTGFVKTFKQMIDSGLEPNTTSFNILMGYLTHAGNPNDGPLVLDYMKGTLRGRPDVVTYTTLIQNAVENKKVEMGWSLYDEMMQRSIKPTLHTYSILIELVKLDPRNQAGREIVKRHFIPGREHIRFPIKKIVEDRIGLKFASGLYNQLCNQGLKPNQHIFGGLLDLTVREGYMKAAQHVYMEMVNKNVGPNTAIMTTLIKGFAIQRDFGSGWKVWKGMVEMNIPRNVITYHHLFRLCERSFPKQNAATTTSAPEEADNVDPIEKEEDANQRTREQDTILAMERNMKEKMDRWKPETSSNIPSPIWNEILEQMKVDHVHWSRLQQFRKKKIDSAMWAPVAQRTHPVRAASKNPKDADDDRSDHGSEGEDMTSSYLSTIEGGEYVEVDSDIPMIREIYTGSGDLFEPKRAPTSSAPLVAWDDVLKSVHLEWPSKKNKMALQEQ